MPAAVPAALTKAARLFASRVLPAAFAVANSRHSWYTTSFCFSAASAASAAAFLAARAAASAEFVGVGVGVTVGVAAGLLESSLSFFDSWSSPSDFEEAAARTAALAPEVPDVLPPLPPLLSPAGRWGAPMVSWAKFWIGPGRTHAYAAVAAPVSITTLATRPAARRPVRSAVSLVESIVLYLAMGWG